jgi:hypothetical protein
MNIKVGDLVTSRWKGYFRVVDIQNTNGRTHLYVRQEYDTKGKPRKSKEIKFCDSSYCKLAKDVLPVVCDDLSSMRNRLLDIWENESGIN